MGKFNWKSVDSTVVDSTLTTLKQDQEKAATERLEAKAGGQGIEDQVVAQMIPDQVAWDAGQSKDSKPSGEGMDVQSSRPRSKRRNVAEGTIPRKVKRRANKGARLRTPIE